MSIFRLNPDYFDTLSLEANPTRTFSSSSSGITGSVYLFAERSPIEKEAVKQASFEDRTYGDDSIEGFREELVDSVRNGTSTSFSGEMEKYLSLVNSQSVSQRKQKQAEIIRFTPSVRFTSDTLRKNVVQEVLFPYYRPWYPSCQWAYTNYHTLNFFTASQVPTGSCMVYPAASSSISATDPRIYMPSSSFTFDFYINPRYTTDNDSADYTAGTIFHMSSSYAVSLVSGSGVGVNGRPDKFRIMLQLSYSAEVAPSLVSLTGTNNQRPKADSYNTGRGNGDLIFLSSDNSLGLNKWHHIGIRWGAEANNGTGSFVIDGKEDTKFIIPSATCMQKEFNSPVGDPDALFIGNFYDGANNSDSGALISQFFNPNAALKEGVTDLFGGDTSIQDPPENRYNLSHPLNAEVHDLKLWDSHRSVPQLVTASQVGFSELPKGLLFYVPPYFVKETRKREVLQSPFQSFRTTTDDPFNVALSFGVGGRLLNLENFVREFRQKQYPRLLLLTASTNNAQTNTAQTCNSFLFATGSIRKRNLSVLPCDNGRFVPGFKLLSSGTLSLNPGSESLLNKYTNHFGALDFSYINLTELIPTGTLQKGLFQYAVTGSSQKKALNVTADPVGRGFINPRNIKLSPEGNRLTGSDGGYILLESQFPDAVGTGSIAEGIMGASPENPGVTTGSILTIFQRTRDNTSDEVVFFDASNLFYGGKIKEESFSLKDPSVTGSGGKVVVTLKDNGIGGLYRADALTPHPKWSNVGNILYEEGLAIIKSPNIPFFGKDQFEVTLKGVHNIHVLEMNIPCNAGSINSSSNPSFKKLKPSDYAGNVESEFVYITGLNFHDENLNVIARSNLAQPVVKKDDDKFKFRVKLDF